MRLGLLAYILGAVVTEVEVDVPTARATHTISTMGGMALIPGRRARDW